MTGTGTLEDPYIILTRAELESIGDDMTAHYALGNDISLAGADWTPIGFNPAEFWSDTEFTGSLDGRLHKIVGMVMHPTTDWMECGGLIGWLSGDVRDLSICDVAIYMPSGYYSMDGVGFLCAETGGANIVGVTCSGTVYLDGSDLSGSSVYDIGGIAGYNWTGVAFSLCRATLSIVVHGTLGYWGNVGGIIGSASSYQATDVVVDCVASLTIANDEDGDATTLGSVGGIAGYLRDGATFVRCRSNVNIKADVTVSGSNENYYFGGLVGYISIIGEGDASIRDSSSAGTLSCTYDAGGLIGKLYLQLSSGNFPSVSVERCSADVDVHVGSVGGGFVGLRSGNVTAAYFTNCYALGLVHCHEPADSPSDCIGGFVGSDLAGSVYTNCYAAGEVVGEVGGTEIGGFAGQVWA